jgi:ArsR family transcriptional regulator, arsenate/arsenite/antimonite-responsive transcriptional repressor / arsenate reductase (thioredoxin)
VAAAAPGVRDGPSRFDRVPRAPLASPAGPQPILFVQGDGACGALAEQLSAGEVRAASAGSHPKPLHPNAVRVMREREIDLAGRRSKHLSEFTSRRFDYVISVCDRVRQICPEFPGTPQAIHWSVRDPAHEPGPDDETLPAFKRTAAELETRIRFLCEAIAHTTDAQEVVQHA